ncbi:hypothetical protein AK812_SmicGene34070 [Symbiodinium microadriaticum]|uniref:Uncharacterized protein n=1 Tax=Symbiodinium microadriaticum TaxID=2951 RepID=A0A1Q9CQ03_SYMMI|nr:hypothetical protein AK812_SmicGene34070 [Symbiodinium microadriaticum]
MTPHGARVKDRHDDHGDQDDHKDQGTLDLTLKVFPARLELALMVFSARLCAFPLLSRLPLVHTMRYAVFQSSPPAQLGRLHASPVRSERYWARPRAGRRLLSKIHDLVWLRVSIESINQVLERNRPAEPAAGGVMALAHLPFALIDARPTLRVRSAATTDQGTLDLTLKVFPARLELALMVFSARLCAFPLLSRLPLVHTMRYAVFQSSPPAQLGRLHASPVRSERYWARLQFDTLASSGFLLKEK